MNGRLNCGGVVNVLQLCQARLLSSDKSKDDIPKAKPDHTARNVVIGAGVLAVGGAVYYVSLVLSLKQHGHCTG